MKIDETHLQLRNICPQTSSEGSLNLRRIFEFFFELTHIHTFHTCGHTPHVGLTRVGSRLTLDLRVSRT
jgi:hypothetical protein